MSHHLPGCSQGCPVFVEILPHEKKKPHLVRGHLVALLPNGNCHRSCPATNCADGSLDAQGGQRSRNTEDCVRDHVYPGTSPRVFKCSLVLMIRPIHSLTYVSLAQHPQVLWLGRLVSHFRLSQVVPAVVAQRLDEATLQLEKTMKGTAVTKGTDTSSSCTDRD